MSAARAAGRPRVVLGCLPGLEQVLLTPAHWERLDAVADVLDRAPLGGADDDRADALLAEADVLLSSWFCPRLDEALLARAPRLGLVAHAAGTVKDHITPAVFDRGIRVTSAAAANAVPVAEYTLAAILLANKRAFWASQEWHAHGEPPNIGHRPGNVGRTVGIVSASHVGRLVMEHLRSFDLRVLLFDPFVDDDAARALGAEKVHDLTELCARSDVVSVHAPLLPETEGLIGAEQLAAMADRSTIINTARGRIVEREALERELVSGRIDAVIDTSDPEPLPPDSPLRGCTNVFVTPHIAGSMGAEVQRLATYAIAEIERFARGEPLRYEVRAADWDRVA